ncbi:MAG: hypothetical protein J7K78_00305 [Thaumarchaeota archaeon]|nr:hypothetical protein [Nitrososphaerota archaeon]
MRSLGLLPISVIMVMLLLSGSIGAIYAQAGVQNIDEDLHELRRLRLHAEVLQRMLERAAAIANISESLQNKISVMVGESDNALPR